MATTTAAGDADGIHIRRFEPADEVPVLEVLQAAFGRWPGDVSGVSPADFFRWKYAEKPFGRPTRLVAVLAGEIVGFNAYIPWLVRADTRTIPVVRGVDLAVHPAFHGRGVGMALIRNAPSFIPPAAAFTWSNPNAASLPRVLRSRRRHAAVAVLPRFVGRGSPVRAELGRASEARAGTLEHIPIDADSAANVLVRSQDGPAALGRVSEATPQLATVKDLDYLRWRYGHFQEYRAITTAAADLAIFRIRRHGRFWVSYVCELFADPNDTRAVRQLLRRIRQAAPAHYIRCGFQSLGHAARCGFVRVPGAAELTVRRIHEDLVPDPFQATSWELSLGDLELL